MENNINNGIEASEKEPIPNNLESHEVLKLIEEDAFFEKAILMIKPDGLNKTIDGISVQSFIENELAKNELKALCSSNRNISWRSVFRIYRDTLKRNYEDDEKFGRQWKHDVVNHVSSDIVMAYLIVGDDAENKSKSIKNHLRSVLCDPTDAKQKVVENVAHVADEKDFDVTLKQLFL